MLSDPAALQRDALRYRFLRRRLNRLEIIALDNALIAGCIDPKPDLFDAIIDRHADRSSSINTQAAERA